MPLPTQQDVDNALSFSPLYQLRKRTEHLQKSIDALTTQRDALAEALRSVTTWFRDVPGALTNGELLLPGCPNDLAVSIDKARAALALVEGAE